MKRPRSLLLLVLIYIGFDLSLPMMPGAFVFDPGQSIESVGRTHSRLASEAVAHPMPARASAPAPRLEAVPARVVPRSRIVPVAPLVVRRWPAARGDAARSSEDPH